MRYRPMQLVRRAWTRLRGTTRFGRSTSESDVERDDTVANSRTHGGPRQTNRINDAGTTTGTARNELFVGRAAGDDLGYADETGAEARAAARRSRRER